MTWAHEPSGPWVAKGPRKSSLCLVDLSEEGWRSELWCPLHPEDWLCGRCSQAALMWQRAGVMYSTLYPCMIESEKLEMENALRSLGPFPNCLKVAPHNVFFIALSSQLPPFPWGEPFHVVIDLVVRKIFLMCRLNFPWLTFIPLLQLKPPSQLLTSFHLRPFPSIRGNKWVWSSKALCV